MHFQPIAFGLGGLSDSGAMDVPFGAVNWLIKLIDAWKLKVTY